MSKTFNQVKLNVNFTAISPSSNMSNIESDDNISETFAKIHHWYVKTNGFQASSSPLVSTSNDGIVTTLPSTTGGFLKNTGTSGGTWTTIGISDLPRDINFERVITTHGELYMKAVFEPKNDGDGTEININDTTSGKAQLGRSDFRWSRIYGVNLYATKLNDVTIPNNPVFTDTIPYISSITGPNTGNGISNISFDDDGAVDIEKATFLTEHPSITKQTDTTSTASPAHGGSFTVVDDVKRDTNGHVTKINTKTVTLPSDKDTITTVSTTGSGNAITAITASNGALTATKGSTFSLSTHTHDSLVSKTLTAETLDDTSGNFFFKGNNLLGNVYDWVGIQADSGVDKFQLTANDNTLMFRQNDGISGEVEAWKDWVGLLTPVDVIGNNGITVTGTDSSIGGTGATAFQYTRGVNIQHTNSVTAETTFDKSRFKYDAQGHVTSSSYWVHKATGTGNTAGWIKIATMVHTKTYNSTPIMLTIAQRGTIPTYRLHIRFKNANSTDPDIESFFLAGDVFNLTKKPSAYIIKSATSTWDLYIKKLDNYENLVITEFDVGGYFSDHMIWTWKDEQVAESAITGGTEATIYDYSRIDHTHSEYIPMTGSSAITGNLEITKSSGPAGFYAKRSDTNVRVYFGVGDGGTAEGIYSYTSGGWVFKNDGGNTSIPRITGKSITIGGITVPTSTGSFLVTGNTSYTATVTSSTSGSYTIGTLKIGGTDTTIYGKDTVYTHPSGFTAKTTAGFYKYTVNANGHVTAGAALAKSDITALGISASDHTHSNYLGAATTSSTYYGMADPDGTTTNWIRTTEQGIIPYESGSLGSGHQSLGTATWYFKNSYIDNMTTGFITIAGELPQLKFQQKTSGSEYNNANAGIKCYPSGSKDVGMNMTIQSGGNMIIGSGEYPTSFYNATKFSAESYTASGEQTYIGSDNNVYVITSAQSIADRKVFAFGSNFNLAAGGKLVFRYGTTYDSLTNHSLTSDATTTARTWTLPNATGTIALTSDIPTVSISRNLTSGTKVGTITINGTGTDLYCQTNTDTKVTDTVGTANTYYPAGLTATSTTTGTQVFDTSLKFIGTTGSKSAVGKAQLVLGNATASGTANNKQGSIVVYGSTAYAHTIQGAPTAARTLTLPNATGTLALTSDLSSYIPLSGSSAIDGNLTPHASNTYSLGSSSYKWNEIYVTYANIGSLYQANGTAGGSITSYSSIVPNSTNYNLGSTSKKWGTIYVEQISDATTGATHAVGQLVSTTGHSSMLGPLIPKVNSDANCTLGSSSYNWYAVYASNIYSNGYKVWDAGNSYVSFTCTSANTTNYTIDKQRCYCIFGKFVVINMSITTSTTFAANTAYSIATIPSAYTAGSSYVVLGTGHYQVGSPVTPTVSAWINGTSIKFSTTTANSTSTTKTIRVSFTYAMS